MQWVIQLTGFFSAALLTVFLSPSLKPFPPAEAIRSSTPSLTIKSSFTPAPVFQNQPNCHVSSLLDVCNPSLIHVAITLDTNYLRGSVAAVHSTLRHASCPDNVFFHVITSEPDDSSDWIQTLFPNLNFKIYHFDMRIVQHLISTSIRHALEEPLNYARNYLANILPSCVRRVIYLDSDVILVDDINKLYTTFLGPNTIGVPEYCHANFTKYFTNHFWSDPSLSSTFSGRAPCYFNTGVMVIDLVKWRVNGYTRKLEKWMEIQRAERIYELGSLPPFLLVFGGHVAGIEHRWNQHGLGGDNVRGSCRDLHPGPVSLLHWSGSGKPWARLDAGRACPLDSLWAPYDLYVHTTAR